ncbi:MAG: hypothetical protein VW520_05765, partial [Candidatus Puniceispirillum sp.]
KDNQLASSHRQNTNTAQHIPECNLAIRGKIETCNSRQKHANHVILIFRKEHRQTKNGFKQGAIHVPPFSV